MSFFDQSITMETDFQQEDRRPSVSQSPDLDDGPFEAAEVSGSNEIVFPQNVSSATAHNSNLHETAPSAASSNIDEAATVSVLPETEVGFNEASGSSSGQSPRDTVEEHQQNLADSIAASSMECLDTFDGLPPVPAPSLPPPTSRTGSLVPEQGPHDALEEHHQGLAGSIAASSMECLDTFDAPPPMPAHTLPPRASRSETLVPGPAPAPLPPQTPPQVSRPATVMTTAHTDDELAFFLPNFSEIPPVSYNIFDPLHHGDKYAHIQELVGEVNLSDTHSVTQEYMRDFTAAIEGEVMMIGSIPLDDVVEEESRVKEDGLQRLSRERNALKKHKDRLNEVIEKARAKLAAMLQSKMGELRGEATRLRQQESSQRDAMTKAFRAAESQLIDALERRKGEIQALYGDLVLSDGLYAGNRGRRWRIDWDRTPQPVQIRLTMLRGVRDRLPAGQYSMVVSLQDRLGGRLLRWSALRGQEWGAATLPVFHNGRYGDSNLHINQSVFTACPSRPDIRPSMVMVFELYLLSGDVSPTDRVVAWSAFPIADTEFHVLGGHFKTPFLRGPVDARIDKFGKIERRISRSLENWLGNLYFEIVKLPRYVSGQREYEVALQFSSGLLGYPQRLAVDAGDVVDPKAAAAAAFSVPTVDRPVTSFGGGILRRRIATAAPGKRVSIQSLGSLEEGLGEATQDITEPIVEWQATGQNGLTYRLHTASVFDQYQKEVVRMVPNSRLSQPRVLSEQERLDQHTYSVVPLLTGTHATAAVKLQYVRRQLLAELGLAQIKSGEFWFSILALLLMFWLRLYAHYFGQWLYLQSLRLPVNDFTFLPVSVSLNYQASAFLAREEIGVVCLGPIMLICVMLCLTGLSALSQWLLGSFSNLGSRFLCAWGLLTILDPVLILLVDLAMQRWRFQYDQAPVGDAFKLYWHFYNSDGSGLPGVFLTLFLYIVLMATAVVIFYIYFLRLHMNGRMMDAFQRLNAAESDFFLPYDSEISLKELSRISQKAEQWRGPKGERRKTAVYDYVWDEEDGGREVTTHVSVHTVHLDGSRDVFRQFLRLPDGAVVEVFGAVAAEKLDGRVRASLARANVDLGRLLSGATTYVNTHMQTTGDLLHGSLSAEGALRKEVMPSMRRGSTFGRVSLQAVESQA